MAIFDWGGYARRSCIRSLAITIDASHPNKGYLPFGCFIMANSETTTIITLDELNNDVMKLAHASGLEFNAVIEEGTRCASLISDVNKLQLVDSQTLRYP